LKILLDENFPMPLYRRLRMKGCHVEHIIALGQRGLPDVSIQKRLREEPLLFLTQGIGDVPR
jgi:predicted nuclease of predicted toxin-antitoxin system